MVKMTFKRCEIAVKNYEKEILTLWKWLLRIVKIAIKHGETGIKHCENDAYILWKLH